MATYQNINEIQSAKGGNRICLVELSTSLAIPGTLTPDTNCIDLGHLKESQTGVTSSVTKLKNEAQEVVQSEYDFEGMTTGVLMQTSKRILDFVAFTVRNKTYLQYRKAGVVNGKTQEFFAVGKVTPQATQKNPNAAESNNYEFTAFVNDSSVTFSTANLASISTALSLSGVLACTVTVTIPAGQEFLIVETS